MFYRYLWIGVNLALRVFYRRMYFTNVQNLPKKTPVILACNHPNSFFDGILLACLLARHLHFLVRADVFSSKFKSWVLSLMYLVPIFRMQEGKKNLHKNDRTFSKCYEVLKANNTILIFTEGVCVVEKRLRKLKKGTARMAFGAVFGENIDVHVVPVGINYNSSTTYRKEVMVDIGQPIKISDYRQVYEESPGKAMQQLNDEIEKSLRTQMVIIDNVEDEEVCEQLFEIHRNDFKNFFFQWKYDNRERLELEMSICEKVNSLAANPTELSKLKREVNGYYESLQQFHIKDEPKIEQAGFPIGDLLILLVAWPLFLPGYVINFLPITIGKKVTENVVKDVVFYGSVMVGSGYALYSVLYIIAVVASLFTGVWWVTVAVLLAPFFSFAAIFYQDLYHRFIHRARVASFRKAHREAAGNLARKRQEIIAMIKN